MLPNRWKALAALILFSGGSGSAAQVGGADFPSIGELYLSCDAMLRGEHANLASGLCQAVMLGAEALDRKIIGTNEVCMPPHPTAAQRTYAFTRYVILNSNWMGARKDDPWLTIAPDAYKLAWPCD